MTATLYRRLVDLPPGFLAAYPDARTTDDVIAGEEIGCSFDSTSVADDDFTRVANVIRETARARNQRVFIAILSDPQCHWLGAEPDSKQAARIVRYLEQAAADTLLMQRVIDLSDRNIVPNSAGKPATVVVLWDGRIRPKASQRSRSRRDMRVTLDDDVLEWIDREAERRGDSRSSVVQDALRRAMDMHKTVARLKAEATSGSLQCEFECAASDWIVDEEDVASAIDDATDRGATRLHEMRPQGWRAFRIRDLSSNELVEPSERELLSASRRYEMVYSVRKKVVSANRL